MHRMTVAIVFAASCAAACSKPEPRAPRDPARAASPVARPAPAPTPAPTPAPAPVAAVATAEPTGAFSIHEWGLVSVVAGETTGHVATEVLRQITPPPGLGFLGTGGGYGYGGKPVLYVHLDPGVTSAQFTLDVGLGANARFDEHWPPATVDGGHLRFENVQANAGACSSRTAPPSGGSAACRTADHFCEAAEIPRYEADHDVCLTVGDSRTDLLFYRASGVDVTDLPVTMQLSLDLMNSPSVMRRDDGSFAGPVLVIQRNASRHVTIRRVAASQLNRPLAMIEGETLSVADTRAWLVGEARSRGLTEAEAEAFVDAWAPAFFDHCRRHGPEAHGHAPTALAEVDRSVLYFAPPELVDTMVSLRTRPAAHATSRVFLVRLVDGTSVPPPPSTPHVPFETDHFYVRASIRPIVQLGGSLTVRGGLSADQIRRVARRNISQVQHCYEQGLQRNPSLAGRITVAFMITPTGSVGGSSVADNSLGDSAVGTCVAGAVRRWQFPVPSQEGPVAVRLPFSLSLSQPR